jgi:hypothetical protein
MTELSHGGIITPRFVQMWTWPAEHRCDPPEHHAHPAVRGSCDPLRFPSPSHRPYATPFLTIACLGSSNTSDMPASSLQAFTPRDLSSLWAETYAHQHHALAVASSTQCRHAGNSTAWHAWIIDLAVLTRAVPIHQLCQAQRHEGRAIPLVRATCVDIAEPSWRPQVGPKSWARLREQQCCSAIPPHPVRRVASSRFCPLSPMYGAGQKETRASPAAARCGGAY